MTPKLAIEHLTKSYGAFKAVDDLSLNVPEGCVFGLLGRNGAGKTTTFGCALGLTRPLQGRVLFDGHALTTQKLQDISYVPETPALYAWMTGQEHIEMQRRTYRNFDAAYARRLVDLFELPLKKRVRTLSKGQKTATALVLAFAQRPQIMFFDEPSSGLDPLMQRRLLDLIVQAGADGVTVVFSSHQIGQIERAAETIAIVDRGKIALESNLEDLRVSRKIVEATFAGTPQPNGVQHEPGVLGVNVRGNLLQVRTGSHIDDVVRAVESMHPTSLRILDQTLEDVFLATIQTPTEVVK